MLQPRQIGLCTLLAIGFWASATLALRLAPSGVTGAWAGDLGFFLSVPVAALSIRLTCCAARLQTPQVLPGCTIVLGVAMLIDGIALRWFHVAYTTDERTARLGAAWLLWGYGLSALIAWYAQSRAGTTRFAQFICAAEPASSNHPLGRVDRTS